MIIRRRTTRSRPSVVGFVAAVVASVSLALLNNNFLDVWSFSTTSTSHISPRHSQYVATGSNWHDEQKNFFPKPGTTEEGKCHRTLTTKTSGGKSDRIERKPQSQRQKSKNKNHNKHNSNNKYKDRQEQQRRERQRRELQNKLHRARDSILYYGQHDSSKDLPSVELRSGILPEIVRSYTSAIYESSLPAYESDEHVVLNLFDPWESRRLILEESRPIQERILGLVAVMIQMNSHVQEEYALYNNNINNKDYNIGDNRNGSVKPMLDSTKRVIDQISTVQSQLWGFSREVLMDMIATQPKKNGTEILKEPHVVSPIAITALAKALRESRTKSRFSREDSSDCGSGVDEIKELMQLVDSARKEMLDRKSAIEIVPVHGLDSAMESVWNYYLSSLCDRAEDKKNPNDTGLGTAARLVMQNDNGGIVDSNIISYNTVMNVAAKAGNATLVDAMWKDLIGKQGLSLKPNSRTYNCRLMVTNDDKQRLKILDKEIIPAAFQLQRDNMNASASADSSTVIDSFTIDMMMMPLLQANRKKHLLQLIDHWMALVNRQHNVHENGEDHKQQQNDKNRAQRAFKNAMAAFFITLVQRNGDVRTARELWNRYMISNIDNHDESNNVHTDAFLRSTNIVSPERRHYNILLDGYARLVDQVRDRQARQQGRILDDDSFVSNEKEKRTKKIWEAAAIRKIDEEKENRDVASTSEFYEQVQEKAIRDGQDLFALMMAEQQQRKSRNNVGPDAYTKSTMIRLCRSALEVQNMLQQTSSAVSNRKTERIWFPRAVTRAAVITCGRLGDPSMSCVIFDQFMFTDDSNSQKQFSNYRAFNTLLGALAAGAKLDNPRLDVTSARPSFLLSEVHGLTCTEAVVHLLNLMTKKNSQTYCVAASALQYAPTSERMFLSQTNTATNATTSDVEETTPLALKIFNNATRDGIHADGRLVNAIFRCYGSDIAGALAGWKSHIRTATYEYEQSSNRIGTSNKKNMLAAYSGLMYVCGRAERPDIAVRIVYAMKNKEGLDPSENPYNNYRSGKNTRKNLVKQDKPESSWRGILPKIGMVKQYENILFVECKSFDTRDKRMEKDNRIRIIV